MDYRRVETRLGQKCLCGFSVRKRDWQADWRLTDEPGVLVFMNSSAPGGILHMNT